MTESWEEKTERLEREYQARIDRLREELREARDIAGVVAANVREIGDGAMAQLKSDNAALTKRVAELEVDVLKSDADAVMWRERALNTSNKHAALIELKSANDERLCKEVALLRQQVGDLQSQLAWTPVSAGLPTEPGLYVFTCRGDEKLYTITEGKFLEHTDNGTDPWDASAMRYWTNYRRIELPKDGES